MKLKNMKVCLLTGIMAAVLLAGCSNDTSQKTDESNIVRVDETIAADEYGEQVIFLSAPDGTVINVPTSGIDVDYGEKKSAAGGYVLASGTYNDDEFVIGYVNKENAHLLENIEDMYSQSGEDDGELLGTDAKRKEGMQTSQLYIKDGDNRVYLPLAIAYADSEEGYIYTVLMDKGLTDDSLDAELLGQLLTNNWDGYAEDTARFFKNFIKICNR